MDLVLTRLYVAALDAGGVRAEDEGDVSLDRAVGRGLSGQHAPGALIMSIELVPSSESLDW